MFRIFCFKPEYSLSNISLYLLLKIFLEFIIAFFFSVLKCEYKYILLRCFLYRSENRFNLPNFLSKFYYVWLWSLGRNHTIKMTKLRIDWGKRAAKLRNVHKIVEQSDKTVGAKKNYDKSILCYVLWFNMFVECAFGEAKKFPFAILSLKRDNQKSSWSSSINWCKPSIDHLLAFFCLLCDRCFTSIGFFLEIQIVLLN